MKTSKFAFEINWPLVGLGRALFSIHSCITAWFNVRQAAGRQRPTSPYYIHTQKKLVGLRGHHLGRFDKLRDEVNGNGEDDCRVLFRCDGTEGLRQEKLLLVHVKKILGLGLMWSACHKKRYLLCVELTNFGIFTKPFPIFFQNKQNWDSWFQISDF